MNSRQKNETRIMIVLSIIQQLMTTRSNKIFKNLPLNSSEFGLLSHFSHNPQRSWTVSELAEVMEMNQPGITTLVSYVIGRYGYHV